MEKFEIPPLLFREPTDEERVARAVRNFEYLDGICMDQLPPDVLALSPETLFVELPQETKALWDEKDDDTIEVVADALRPLFLNPREPRFFKLSTRSPKESHWIGCGVETWTPWQAIRRMQVSERCLDDAVLYLPHPTYRLKACSRKMMPFVPHYEVRCFVKGGRFLAAAAYDPKTHLFWQADNFRQEARREVEEFWRGTLHPRMSVETYVFDYVLDRRWQDTPLVEINPYGHSDPCALLNYENVENFSGDVAVWPTGKAPMDGLEVE